MEALLKIISLNTLSWWIVGLPLAGAILNGLRSVTSARLGGRPHHFLTSLIGCLLPIASFFITLFLFLILMAYPEPTMNTAALFKWAVTSDLIIPIGLKFDQLSLVMSLVVTGVGSLIHVYSIGYMGHDEGYTRYFCYLNGFLFFMLVLVLADNLVFMFVGWEGVGLCSYLLIGFWFTDYAKAWCGKKAFIVNRIGDAGFLVGLFLLYSHLRSQQGLAQGDYFDFATLRAYSAFLIPAATPVCLLFFLGACGKSAQIPLYVWLPDAMAGPTPVSALIHAATMVTAGVYMVSRLSFLYVLSPIAMKVVAVTGLTTALLAAIIALAQTDIKKVLAYSTISQLGYMFLACGVGAFGAAIFHLMTHAFFKALLFLGSGSVIHALDGEQDIRKFGGLRYRMPVTTWTFLIGAAAIAGIFPLSGFFSKDAILWASFSQGGFGLWVLALVGAGLTAFYMFRLVGYTFFGASSLSSARLKKIHEASPSMLTALILLAVFSVIGGWIGIPEVLGGGDVFGGWIRNIFAQSVVGEPHPSRAVELTLMAISFVFVLHFVILAWVLYTQKRDWGEKICQSLKPLCRLISGKFFVDEIYDWIFVKPIVQGSQRVLWQFFDATLIDRIGVHGTGAVISLWHGFASRIQSGLVGQYLIYFILGVGLILWMLLF